MSRRVIYAFLVLLLTLSACTAIATPASTMLPQDSLTPSITQKSTNTPSRLLPTATQTILPTKTPKPTATITATPLPLFEPPKGITYRNEKGLYITEGSGQTELLFEQGKHEYAVLSPDGSSVLLYDYSSQYLVDVETGDKTLIWPREGYNLCPFSWVNRQPLVMIGVVLSEGADPGYSCNQGSPVLLSLDGEFSVFDKEGTGYSLPDISTDGNFMAYELEGKPFLYEWGQGSKQLDVSSFGFPDVDEVVFTDPSWSPGGAKLAWTYRIYDSAGDLAERGIVTFNFETKTCILYAPYSIYEYEGLSPNIIWNGDETFISLWHFDGARDDFVSDMISVDGNYARALEGNFQSWSPNADLFTIDKYVEGERRWDLYIESPDGSVSYPVCYDCSRWALWSPDGKQLLTSSNNGEYRLIDLDTGNTVKINLPPGSNLVSWETSQ